MDGDSERFHRRLPHNVEAEMAVLGAILVDNSAYDQVFDVLRSEHFILLEHSRIFDACGRLIERGQIADPVTLKGWAEADGGIQGGQSYLGRLADAAVTVASATAYARAIADDAQRRQLIALGEDVVNRAYAGAEAPAAIAAAAISDLGIDAPLADCPPIDLLKWDGVEPPTREWIVEDWIPAGCVTALYGDGGTGKSLLAQMLATACVTGGTWLGLPATRCPAIGLWCEDDSNELISRQANINAAMGVGMRDLGNLDLISRVGDDNLLMTFDRDGRGMLSPLWHDLRRLALRRGARLVIVDTAADTFGGNEISRPQVRQFISACLSRLALDIGGAVLLCAHPSVRGMADGSGVGGSTAWSNTVRSRLYLTRPDASDDGDADPDRRILARRKSNYARIGNTIPIRWEHGVFRVELGMGTGMVGSIERRAKERAAEEAFLRCLDAAVAQGRSASATSNASIYAPRVFCSMPEAAGFRRRDLELAMERLFATKVIHVTGYLKPNRHSGQRIERTPGGSA